MPFKPSIADDKTKQESAGKGTIGTKVQACGYVDNFCLRPSITDTKPSIADRQPSITDKSPSITDTLFG